MSQLTDERIAELRNIVGCPNSPEFRRAATRRDMRLALDALAEARRPVAHGLPARMLAWAHDLCHDFNADPDGLGAQALEFADEVEKLSRERDEARRSVAALDGDVHDVQRALVKARWQAAQ